MIPQASGQQHNIKKNFPLPLFFSFPSPPRPAPPLRAMSIPQDPAGSLRIPQDRRKPVEDRLMGGGRSQVVSSGSGSVDVAGRKDPVRIPRRDPAAGWLEGDDVDILFQLDG